MEFFQSIKGYELKNARITAFSSTRKPGVPAAQDNNFKTILEIGVKTATLFGKAWDFHVLRALETTLEENLAMVKDSIIYLKERGLEVLFDAEHFFDGYKNNQSYALEVLRAAEAAGADWIVLCDTNGGAMPWEIEAIVEHVVRTVKTPLGIHVHNDSALAAANSLVAVRSGCTQVQGTVNGYGERCGNADLCVIIPSIELKMDKKVLPPGSLKRLTESAHFISEVANMPSMNNQPYIGHSAFAHKAGIHVSALLKDSMTYEHINPEDVGNHRRVLVSELSGLSNLLYKAKEFGIDVNNYDAETRTVIKQIKEMENQGFQFEGADASLELFLRRAFGQYQDFFQLKNMKIILEKHENSEIISEAMLKIAIGDEYYHTVADGDGPVNAMDNSMRRALQDVYPEIKDMHLTDYKVRVLNGEAGTAAKVRVLVESANSSSKWTTVGVSENIIEASWQAMVDSINFMLMKKQMTN